MRPASRSGGPRLPPAGTRQRYALALGSNRRHGHHGPPAAVLEAALAALRAAGMAVVARSRIAHTAAIGPGGRRYANAAAVVETSLDPPALLRALKAIERAFGRRPGRRWGARVLDLDILLWSGGRWAGRHLLVPHPRLAERRFVLDPLHALAGNWRPPASPAIRHLHGRLTHPRPLHR